tara:strand:- start:235 stop:684 length:450 start_codon:yes stop_codon:yes gene_type:complete
MTGKQVKSIMIGSVLIIGGVISFGKNRRKKNLYQAISDTIDKRGGVAVGDDAFDVNADTSGCKLSESQSKSIAKKIESSMWGEWWQLGFGTKEEKLFANLRSIPSQTCLTKVAASYESLYNENMDGNIRSELSGTDLAQYQTIVTQEIR